MSLAMVRNQSIRYTPMLWFRNFAHDKSLHTIKMDYAFYQMPHNRLKAPPILVMHDLIQSRASWRRVARNLSKHGPRHVITVDARNHGRSPCTVDHTPAHMAADVNSFMDHKQIKRIVALGHGMGGRTMMTLALTQPKRVERAIFVDITTEAMPSDVFPTPAVFDLMQKLAPEIPKHLTLSEGRMFVVSSLSELIKREEDIQLIVQNLRKYDDESFGWAVNPLAILSGWKDTVAHYDQTLSDLKPYEGETLLIAGKQSNFVTQSKVKAMKKYFPKLEVKYLEAAHRVYEHEPEKFVDLVVAFTRDCTKC